jgi:beta-N-acetylhexosaminidase
MTTKQQATGRGPGENRTPGYLALSVLAVLAAALAACAASSAAPITSLRGALPPKGAAAQQQQAGGAALLPRVRQQDQIVATVNDELAHMSLEEKLGQMFLIETVWQGYNDDVDAMVRQMHAGAMIIYAQNMGSPTQLRGYLADIQAHATLPMMISIDEEGGVVDRLGSSNFAPPLPDAQTLGTEPAQASYNAGVTAAQELNAYDMNTDLAPVADVRTNPFAVEYTRLFGDDPGTVDRAAGAFLDGLQANGVIGTLKHWPGIGSTAADPHQMLPVIARSKAQLEATDFAAFKGLLAHQPGMIMVTHVLVPAYDNSLPATLSPTLVDGVLRGELGYDGVVMTDSLYMKAISLHYSLPEAGVLSVIAGDDLLEGAFDSGSMAAMLAALKSAITAGRITVSRINQSVRRLLTLKARFGLLPLLALPRGPVDGLAATLVSSGPGNADRPRQVVLV